MKRICSGVVAPLALVACSAVGDGVDNDLSSSALGVESVQLDINRIVFANVEPARFGRTTQMRAWEPVWNRYIAEAIADHGKALISTEKPVSAMKELCPLFDSATPEERTAMFALLFAEIARYESAFKTTDTFAEPGQCRGSLPFTAPVPPPTCDAACMSSVKKASDASKAAACKAELASYEGRPEVQEARPHQNFSDGLLSMSRDDGNEYAECKDLLVEGATFDPQKNLSCGVGVLATLVRAANKANTPFVLFPKKHAYWSTLAEKPIRADFMRDSGNLKSCRVPR